mgnify:CR=1 FL=1
MSGWWLLLIPIALVIGIILPFAFIIITDRRLQQRREAFGGLRQDEYRQTIVKEEGPQ